MNEKHLLVNSLLNDLAGRLHYPPELILDALVEAAMDKGNKRIEGLANAMVVYNAVEKTLDVFYNLRCMASVPADAIDAFLNEVGCHCPLCTARNGC